MAPTPRIAHLDPLSEAMGAMSATLDAFTTQYERDRDESRRNHIETLAAIRSLEVRIAAVEPPVHSMVTERAQREQDRADRKRSVRDKAALFCIGIVTARFDDLLALFHRAVAGH